MKSSRTSREKHRPVGLLGLQRRIAVMGVPSSFDRSRALRYICTASRENGSTDPNSTPTILTLLLCQFWVAVRSGDQLHTENGF